MLKTDSIINYNTEKDIKITLNLYEKRSKKYESDVNKFILHYLP